MSDCKNICVYCGSSARVDDVYKEAAKELGVVMAAAGLDLVYGGGRVGLMGIVADSVLAGGGEVYGVITTHLAELEVEHQGLTRIDVVETMHERKQRMVDHADAFVILPGGLGTMDEFFEVMTWRQLGLHNNPVIVVNVDGYWDKLVELIEGLIEKGFAQPSDRDALTVVNDVSEIPEALKAAPKERIIPHTKWI